MAYLSHLGRAGGDVEDGGCAQTERLPLLSHRLAVLVPPTAALGPLARPEASGREGRQVHARAAAVEQQLRHGHAADLGSCIQGGGGAPLFETRGLGASKNTYSHGLCFLQGGLSFFRTQWS